MTHFLVVFDRSKGAIIRQEAFADRRVALRERFSVEREYRHKADIEIVVLGGDSWDALKRTHSRYFQGLHELANSEPLPTWCSGWSEGARRGAATNERSSW